MAQSAAKIRLYVDAPLAKGAIVEMNREQRKYLFTVMRRVPNDALLLFNGRDGEWLATIAKGNRVQAWVTCLERVRDQQEPPDVWVLFAPLKKARTDFVAEKASEMGCRRIWPVYTRHTDPSRVNLERLTAHAVEAAEQCGRLSVPEIREAIPLAEALADWPDGRRLLFCDESGTAPPAPRVLAEAGPGPWAVLTGPEGGFAPEEAERLRGLPFAHPASLGPRVLRAETASVAALAVLQATVGDWR